MALFKIFKGNETAKLVDSNATGYRVPTDGYAYYDTSTKLFYIDADYDGNGTIKRYPINAASAWADSLGNVIKDTYLPLTGGTVTGRITMYDAPINQILTGAGTVGADNGANASPRYVPSIWTFDTGLTASDGDIFTIKVPAAGHNYGVYMSIDNGAHYYPIVLNGTGRLTTHYGVDRYIQVIFESAGSAASITPLAGASSANGSTISGGVFRVLNYYDSGNTNDTTTTYARFSYSQYAPTTALYRYQLLLSHPTDTKKVIPINTTSNSTGTSKTTITAAAFNPFEPIYYYSTTSTVSAGTNIGNSYLWYAYSLTDLRYSFNTGSTLTAHKDVYLVVQMQDDGTAKLRNPGATGTNASAQATGANAGPITQILPTSEDGYVYIKLGHAYDTYRIALMWQHPMYIYKNGAVRHYAGSFDDLDITIEKDSVGSASGWSAGTLPSLTTTTYTVPNVTSAGSASSLTWDEYSIPNVTDVGSAPSLTTTTYTIPNVTNKGTVPSLTTDELTIPNVTSAGSAPSLTTSTYTIPNVTNAGSASSLTTEEFTVPNITDAGSAPSLTTTTYTIPNVTNKGSVPSLTTTTYTVPNVTAAGSAPSLSYTSRTIPNVTSVGSMTILSASEGVLTIVNGTAPTLGTAISADDITAWDAGSATELGPAFSIKGVNTWSAGSTPTLGTAFTVKGVNEWDAGSATVLGTAFSIKGVKTWSAGSVPTLGTAFTVKGVDTWDAGTATTLGTAFTVNSVKTWSAGSTPTLGTAFTVKGVNAWSAGAAPTLGNAFAVKSIKSWSAGSAPTIGTAFSIKGVDTWSAGTVPSLTVTSKTVVVDVTA